MNTKAGTLHRWTLGWLWLALLLAWGPARAQLTETGVEQFLVELEAADQRRDAAAVLRTLAEDVIIVFRYSALGDVPDAKFNKTQYRDFLAQAYAAVESHSSRRFGTRIEVSDDGLQAEVFANVEETTTMDGKTSTYVSQQHVLIRLEDGEPRVKRVFAELVSQGSDT